MTNKMILAIAVFVLSVSLVDAQDASPQIANLRSANGGVQILNVKGVKLLSGRANFSVETDAGVCEVIVSSAPNAEDEPAIVVARIPSGSNSVCVNANGKTSAKVPMTSAMPVSYQGSVPGTRVLVAETFVTVTNAGESTIVILSLAAGRCTGAQFVPPGGTTNVPVGNGVTVDVINPSTGVGSHYAALSAATSTPQEEIAPPKPGDAPGIPTRTNAPTQQGWNIGPGAHDLGFRGIGPQAGYFSTLGEVEVNASSISGTTVDAMGQPCEYTFDLLEKTIAFGIVGVNVDLGWFNIQVSGLYGTYRGRGLLTCTTAGGGVVPAPGPGGPGGGDDVVVLPGPGPDPMPGGDPDPLLVLPGGADPAGGVTTHEIVDVKGQVYGLNLCFVIPVIQFTSDRWTASLSATAGFLWVVETIDKVGGQSVDDKSVEEFAFTYGGQFSVSYSLTAGSTLSLFSGFSALTGGLEGSGYSAGVAWVFNF